MKKFFLMMVSSFYLTIGFGQFQVQGTTGCTSSGITNIGIGTCSPFGDTRMTIKNSSNYSQGGKVGLVVEANSTADYGVLSAVNGSGAKAFSAFNGSGGSYEENFVVFGDGKVFATEVQVQLSPFPDYVFDKDYDLLSLKEFEKFISKNNHLPGFPKGEKVDEEGLGLGKLVLLQQEKIEELSLYIIELNNRLNSLEKNRKKKKK